MKKSAKKRIIRILRNWLILALVFAAAWLLCSSLSAVGTTDTFVPMVFILVVMIVSLATDGYFYGIIASVAGVIGVNYAFTYPYMKLNFSIYGYPITFLTMLAVSVVISTLTTRVHEQEKLRHEAAQAKLRADLLRAISHDLRTPLTSIIGSIDTVINEGEHLSAEERAELLGDAKQDAQWLVRMVENLLSITRISGGETAKIEKSPQLVEEIVGECVSKFRKSCPDVKLAVAIPDEPVTVDADAMLIEQVLMNLLDNAVKHAEGMTELRLEVAKKKGAVRFRVNDNGAGLPERILPVLFRGQIDPDEGQTYDSNRFRGIGLAACYAIVSAHGGAISGFNAPEGGAVFEFTLPDDTGNSEYIYPEEEQHEHQRQNTDS